MVMFSCFSKLFIQRKKKPQKSSKPIDARRLSRIGDLRIKPEELIHPSHDNGTKQASVAAKSPLSYLHVVENKTKDEILNTTASATEVAYEGGDEHDDVRSMKRDFSDFDLQAIGANNGIMFPGFTREFNHHLTENELERVEEATPELLIQSGHVSDPGMKRTVASWGSPSLKRSCSNIERRRSSKFLASPIKSYSYEDLQKLCVNGGGKVHDHLGSPASIMTSGSADKVMLKKRSSSQVLPSRSRKLWWKLFLWSHRNLHKSWTWKQEKTVSENDTYNQRGGYCSDTLEPSYKVDMKMKRPMEEDQGVKTGFWPQNQWVAFCAESSSLDRVSAWVHSLDDSPLYPVDDEVAAGGAYDDMTYTEEGETSCRNLPHVSRHTLEEVVQANHIVESLNSSSSVAHISGMGLKVIPTISAFNSLRAINLSGNFIVHISPGSLPKGLHTLDLSRNKIATIEGLRELAKLRVLNLSYNRICRIGHGLSNCILIKELYLAGNKISDVEGLHRLLKLIVLDLSFNKISTTKALGQLVDNYNSLLALNLLGNPVQTNIGDDQLRKTVCSLLPQLVYLNKQPTKPSRDREVAIHRIAKAALGDIDWNSRKRSMRRTVSNSSNSRGRVAEGSNHKGVGNSSGQKNKQRSKGRLQNSSSLRK